MESNKKTEIREKALELAERAARSTDKALQRDARRILARLSAPPMSDILDKVPGDSVNEKAAAIGVSRITIWYWNNGLNRPRAKPAKRIAQLTGYTLSEIRGA